MVKSSPEYFEFQVKITYILTFCNTQFLHYPANIYLHLHFLVEMWGPKCGLNVELLHFCPKMWYENGGNSPLLHHNVE